MYTHTHTHTNHLEVHCFRELVVKWAQNACSAGVSGASSTQFYTHADLFACIGVQRHNIVQVNWFTFCPNNTNKKDGTKARSPIDLKSDWWRICDQLQVPFRAFLWIFLCCSLGCILRWAEPISFPAIVFCSIFFVRSWNTSKRNKSEKKIHLISFGDRITCICACTYTPTYARLLARSSALAHIQWTRAHFIYVWHDIEHLIRAQPSQVWTEWAPKTHAL